MDTQITKETPQMDLLSYWQKIAAPYFRARFGTTERGASLVEYALLLAFIALVCFAAVGFFGGRLNSKFSSFGSSLA